MDFHYIYVGSGSSAPYLWVLLISDSRPSHQRGGSVTNCCSVFSAQINQSWVITPTLQSIFQLPLKTCLWLIKGEKLQRSGCEPLNLIRADLPAVACIVSSFSAWGMQGSLRPRLDHRRPETHRNHVCTVGLARCGHSYKRHRLVIQTPQKGGNVSGVWEDLKGLTEKTSR